MIDTALFNVGPRETRMALLAGDQVVELVVERTDRPSLVGNIYLGRVTRVVRGIQAAFVDVGLDRSGYLSAADARPPESATSRVPIGHLVHEGEALLVQVQKDPLDGKGVRLTTRLTLPGRYLIFTPGRERVVVSHRLEDAERARLEAKMAGLAEGGGFIVRTAAAGAEPAELAADAASVHRLWDELAARRAGAEPPACLYRELAPFPRALRDLVGKDVRRVIFDSAAALADAKRFCEEAMPDLVPRLEVHRGEAALFDAFAVEEAIERALAPKVALPSGGALLIERVRALWAIDVDTVRHTGGPDFEQTALRTNLEAAEEIARQLRLRNIGGLIVIDFVHMERSDHRQRVVEALRAALAEDRAPSRVLGMAPLGLVEMTRKRTRESLGELLTQRCPDCAGTGRVKTAETIAHDIVRALARAARAGPLAPVAVLAAPEVAELVADRERGFAAEIEAALGHEVELRAEADRARDSFEVVVE
ncbi:MAG: Rne/Rng family ribonuclease [Alphaproteobacteria bacterium]